MSSSSSTPRIGIIGAGIIGLSVAYELAVRRGVRVTVHDVRPPGRGASWAAAGMLAPAFEAAAEPGVHPRLFELCLEGAALWPEFASELAARTGASVGLDEAASLAVALDDTEAARLERIARTLALKGIAHDRLTGDSMRALEPALSADVRGGLELSTDFRVHNRLTVTALLKALHDCPNVDFADGPAALRSVGGQLVLAGHDAIVVAAGWESAAVKVEENGQLYSLLNWETGLDQIDCHGGQMLSVKAGEGAPVRVVRAGHIYLVPRGGEVVIGATMEPGRVINAPEPDVIDALRKAGGRLCPGLADAPVVESWTGVRPGTPDHAPFIGPASTPGLFVAAGHYRNGILLAPVTARIIADQILGARTGDLAAAFSLHRAFAATA
jgi:glycine oxidase